MKYACTNFSWPIENIEDYIKKLQEVIVALPLNYLLLSLLSHGTGLSKLSMIITIVTESFGVIICKYTSSFYLSF